MTPKVIVINNEPWGLVYFDNGWLRFYGYIVKMVYETDYYGVGIFKNEHHAIVAFEKMLQLYVKKYNLDKVEKWKRTFPEMSSLRKF